MVDSEKREIFIAKRIHKTNYSHVAHLSGNPIEWLKLQRHKRGTIIGDTIRNSRNRPVRFARKNLPAKFQPQTFFPKSSQILPGFSIIA